MRKTLTAILLSLIAISGQVLAAGDAAAGKLKAYTCSGCHGIPGYKNTYPQYNVPRLGGQNAAYIAAALNAYKSGERTHSTMNLQAESLSGQEIENIAAWFASQGGPESSGATASDDHSAAGREKSMPCQACHGESGAAVDPMYPHLAGQYASYLANTMKAYRDGSRANPIMAGFAASLSDQDISDLAAWFASQQGLQVVIQD